MVGTVEMLTRARVQTALAAKAGTLIQAAKAGTAGMELVQGRVVVMAATGVIMYLLGRASPKRFRRSREATVAKAAKKAPRVATGRKEEMVLTAPLEATVDQAATMMGLAAPAAKVERRPESSCRRRRQPARTLMLTPLNREAKVERVERVARVEPVKQGAQGGPDKRVERVEKGIRAAQEEMAVMPCVEQQSAMVETEGTEEKAASADLAVLGRDPAAKAAQAVTRATQEYMFS